MSAKDIKELQKVAKYIHQYLKRRVIDEKFGPSPIDKIKDRYRMRILIKCKYDERINNLLNDSLNEFYKLKTNTSRVSVQLNPSNML